MEVHNRLPSPFPAIVYQAIAFPVYLHFPGYLGGFYLDLS
jgi:hypothetical protein